MCAYEMFDTRQWYSRKSRVCAVVRCFVHGSLKAEDRRCYETDNKIDLRDEGRSGLWSEPIRFVNSADREAPKPASLPSRTTLY